MGAFLQVYDCRSGGRKPQILHIDDGLTVDGKVMTARHLLPDIQQERIVALCEDGEFGDVDIPLSDLAPTTLRRGDIHHLTLSLCSLPFQFDTPVTGIEVRQSIVVPQDAIALAGDQHGDGYLGIDLREPS